PIAAFLTQALTADPSDHEAIFVRPLGLNDDRLIDAWLKGADKVHADDEGTAFEKAAMGVFNAWAAIMGANNESYRGLAKYLYRMSRGVLDTLGTGAFETLLTSLPKKRLVTLLATLAKLDNPRAV